MDMKKLLCAVLSGAMVMSFAAVSAFAATSSTTVPYDNDGEKNDDVWGSFSYGGLDSGTARDLNIDGVAPGATVYVALAPAMNSPVQAGLPGGANIILEELCNSDYFKFDVDKDDNGKMVKKISLYDNKKLGDFTNRTSYLKIELADSTTTEDIKSTGTITFKAKNSADNFQNASGSKRLNRGAAEWAADDEIKFNYTFWINNQKKTNDDNPDTGDRVYFDPDKNDTNTMIWGDDRAALKFESDDDPGKFYARLSTKTDNEIYTTYGDPVDADLWFYDFVGNPTVPSTSKATLTLGIPWDDDDDYIPDPTQCFIYERDADGYLVDVTDKFTYSEDDEEIDGWSIKTRTLGTYIVSDTELDIDSYNTNDEPVASSEAPVSSAPTTDGGKVIPNTGSSDMVNVAVVAAVVSLAAAGAVAFRKVK